MNKFDDEYIKRFQKEVYVVKEIKKPEQMSLDLEAYVAGIEEHLKKGFHGTIVEVTPIDSAVYYKDDSGRYERREGVSVLVKVKEDDTVFTCFFSKPGVKGWGKKSNLFQFKKKYNSVPKKGLDVECIVDENGFFRIKF